MCLYEHQSDGIAVRPKRGSYAPTLLYKWNGWVCSAPEHPGKQLFHIIDPLHPEGERIVLAVPIGRVCWLCSGRYCPDNHPCMGKEAKCCYNASNDPSCASSAEVRGSPALTG